MATPIARPQTPPLLMLLAVSSETTNHVTFKFNLMKHNLIIITVSFKKKLITIVVVVLMIILL